MTQQQMVAMIRTLLFFMGKQNYAPTAAAVTPILLEALSAQTLVAPTPAGGWSTAVNKTPSPASAWNTAVNKAK